MTRAASGRRVAAGRLSPAELRRRRQVAGRNDLSRVEQAQLLGLRLYAWQSWIERNGFSGRRLGGSHGDLAAAKVRDGGIVVKVDSNGAVTVCASALEAIGVKPGGRARIRLRAAERSLSVEAVRERA